MVNDGERSNNFANPQQMMYNFQKTKVKQLIYLKVTHCSKLNLIKNNECDTYTIV